VLIFRCAKAVFASAPAAPVGAVVMLALLGCVSARADFLIVGGCVGGRGALNCVVRKGPVGDPYVRQVPPPDTEAEKDRTTRRDQKWMDRCRPVIVQDGYGVPRYHYSAKGCDFGVLE